MKRITTYQLAFVLGVLSACDSTTQPLPLIQKATVCHSGVLTEVSQTDVAARVASGDYVAGMFVNKDSAAGDGIHFQRITDALAAARAARVARNEQELGSCRITITVAAGTYLGSTKPTDNLREVFPIVIDFPEITLRGAKTMRIDAQNRALDADAAAAESSVLLPTPGLINVPFVEALMIVNGHPGGFKGNGVVIEGFTFRSGNAESVADTAGMAILALRVSGLVVQGNRFESNFLDDIDLRASNGKVFQNLIYGGKDCDVCVAGPGEYQVEGNRILKGGIPGVLIVPAVLLATPTGIEQWTIPTTSQVIAHVINNDIRDHMRAPVGVGVRVGAIGIGVPNVAGSVRADIRDNNLEHNMFALIVEGAFTTGSTTLKGDVDLTLSNNVMKSCQTDLLVSFSRHTTALGLTNFPYLKNSNFKLTLNGVKWETAWYSDPANLGNTLNVDGVEIPAGARAAYDATRVCT